MDEALARYVEALFMDEDDALARVRTGHAEASLPRIHVSVEEGRLLHVLVRAVGARRALEIGTLGGYSGIWIARALPPDGSLVTIEYDPIHADYAREAFERAGVADRVSIHVGAALDVLPTLDGPFDMVFVDADKAPMPSYFEEAMRLLRPGGLLLGDNAFLDGQVVDPDARGEDVEGMRAFNTLMARDPRIVSTVVPVRDGLTVGVKQ